MYELIERKDPYDILDKITNFKEFNPPVLEAKNQKHTKELNKCFSSMISLDPAKRPSCKGILSLDMFKSYKTDIDKLIFKERYFKINKSKNCNLLKPFKVVDVKDKSHM